MNRRTNTIVLIHGLWMTPSSMDLFRDFYKGYGYRVLAPAWPRVHGSVEEIRRDPSALAGLGLKEIADHYSWFVRSMEEEAILVGHCFGGLIVQMLLDLGLGAAGVAINAPVPKGIYRWPFSGMQASKRMLANPLNYMRTVTLTYDAFRYALANTLSEDEAHAAYEREVIPGPGRPIFEAAFANLVPGSAATVNRLNYTRPPLLLITGARDNFVPAALNRMNYEKYSHSTATTDYREFPDRSHMIVSQAGWEEVAKYTLAWMQRAVRRIPDFSRGHRESVSPFDAMVSHFG